MNKKKNKDEQQQFEFCEVCRLHHNNGRRHIYFPKHKASLSSLLTRFQSKLSDIKFFLKNPIQLLPEHAHQNRFWCVCCSCDILEVNSQFACGSAIEHLASAEHLKRMKGFMWKHGGGMDRVDMFRITEADFTKWARKCKSLTAGSAKVESVGPAVVPANNIHTEMNADSVNNFHNNNGRYLSCNFTSGVLPLQSYTDERSQISSSALSSVSMSVPSVHHVPEDASVGILDCMKKPSGCLQSQHSSSLSNGHLSNGSGQSGIGVNGSNSSQGFLNLAQIHSASPEAIEGNVHTGAPPPWLSGMEDNGLNIMHKSKHSNFVSRAEKSTKLNPKRVGAAWAERRKIELEMERRGEIVAKDVDANWLPNFGRVWQSGSRKDSKKEFRIESTSSLKVDNHSKNPIQLQPYISKRMRRDTSEGCSIVEHR